jgi:hypothetical protein
LDVLDSCEHKRGLGEFTDAAGADGDALECAPAAGEQGEAAFTETANRAQQHVVGLVVWGEGLPVGGLFGRYLDALTRTLVAGVGQRGQGELGRNAT